MSDQLIVRLEKPESVALTGEPSHWFVNVNGTAYKFEWETDYRVSHHCDPDNEVANLDANGGYPLLRYEF